MTFTDAHDVATEALETFHKIEDGAARLLAARSGEASDALAMINTFTNTAAVAKIASIGDATTKSLLSLVREPAVSRVVAETDEGEVVTYYICRATNITVKGTMLAGYRTPIGRLAVFDVGESVELEVAGKQRGYRILEKLELKPQKSDDLWDAIDSIWRRRRATPQTIPSLRKLVQPVDDNAFLAMLGGGSEAEKIRKGVVHEIRRAMALRDQAILDKIQDEIFRLSIDHQLIILGPPGTGKTTTLIKRLGQKLDVQALSPDEQRLLGPATNRQRWMMFTPSDLLKHYVKEAFNRENVPASDDHIKTWNKRRHDLARSTFGILRTGNSGSCILKEDRHYSSFSVSDDPRQWFADFKAYHQNRLLTSLREGAGLLKDSAPNLLDTVVKELLTTIDELSPEGLLEAYAIWNRIEGQIEPLLKTSRGTTDKLIQQQGSLLYNRNNAVFVELATFLESLGQSEDEIDDGEEFDDDTGTDSTSTPKHTAERRAFQAYQQFLQIHARTLYRNGSLGRSSRAARIRDWLGDRVPPAEWLKTLGREMCFQNALRRFRNAWKRYVLEVPTSYRAFRRECLALELYDYQKPDTSAHIDVTELDAILLLMLRSARELIRQEFVRRHLDDPRFTELAKIADQFLHQVLVDEATDFSTLQLACMESLTDLSTQSFFACGDFNQRITGHGLKRIDQLEWISPRLKARRINTVYRQSQLLNTFAIKLLDLMQGDTEAIGTLPEHSNHEGVQPVLGEHLSEDDASTWVADRIIEIDARMRSKGEDIPTIAVLVTSEDHVRPMADTLTKKLEQISLRATPCADGQSLGNQSDIRVFDVQHIKGLEFEAVFFVGVDGLAEANPRLFERFLYVGATRAATYLGMVCHEKLPARLESIRPLVATHWW